MSLNEYFIGLSRYHVWATRRLLDEHLAALAEEPYRRNSGLFFGSIHGTVNHLLVADNIWWSRFAEKKTLTMPLDTELHAERVPLFAALGHAVQRWAKWLPSVDIERIDGQLHFTRTDGERVCLPFAPTLGHVFNHATHHRGQLTAALTALGRAAPDLDWGALLRQDAANN